MKRILLLFFLFNTFSLLQAQTNSSDIIPMDKNVRYGVLSNGMHYYIRQNSKPEKRAELRLAVNAGSNLEDDNQQGIAHLTEHLAFNGTKNFKKNELVDYLESVGTKFGPHLNAYTSFDETVYMIQIPTDNEEIVNKGMQILEDWSHNLAFDSLEIEKERGVVVEEWRLGQGAGERLRRQYWPSLFMNSRYANRLPIGKKEIIEGSKQSDIKRFYNEWYRPELMAVIVVGDVDLDKMEAKIKALFSGVPVKKGGRELQVFDVPASKGFVYAVATDKEASSTNIDLMYKLPRETTKTVGDYRRQIAQGLYAMMMNDRYDEISRQPNPPFISASGGYEGLVRNSNAFSLSARSSEDGIEKAMSALLTEMERIRRFGFTQSELDRAKIQVMTGMEENYKERDKTPSASFAREYVSNFLTGEPMPGIEYEYEIYKKHLNGITLNEVNAFTSHWVTGTENCTVIITGPEKAGLKMPEERVIKSMIDDLPKLDIAAYTDKVDDKPLMTDVLKGSKVVYEKVDTTFNITEWNLVNGVKVFCKPTSFNNDQIVFTSSLLGGWSKYSKEEFLNAASADELVELGGVGEFDETMLEKKLAGKVVSCSPYISELQQGFGGSTNPRDLETLMQLIYLYQVHPRKDTSAFQSYIQRRMTAMKNRSLNPAAVFSDTISYLMSGYHYTAKPMTQERFSEFNLDRAYEIYKEQFSNAFGTVYFFVGNFDRDSLKLMVQKYLGSLPSSNQRPMWQDINVQRPKGNVVKTMYRGQAPKSQVLLRFGMDFEFNRNNRNEMNALNKLINIRLREVLREDKSGVYGVSCNANPVHFPSQRLEYVISFGCSPANVDSLIEAAWGVIREIKAKGCDDKNLEKIKQTFIRERETSLKENGFWMSLMSSSYQNGENVADILTYNDWVNQLKGSDFIRFAAKYFDTSNYARLVLMPESSSPESTGTNEK